MVRRKFYILHNQQTPQAASNSDNAFLQTSCRQTSDRYRGQTVRGTFLTIRRNYSILSRSLLTKPLLSLHSLWLFLPMCTAMMITTAGDLQHCRWMFNVVIVMECLMWCTGVPACPVGPLQVTDVRSSSAVLHWQPPADDGGRAIVYALSFVISPFIYRRFFNHS